MAQKRKIKPRLTAKDRLPGVIPTPNEVWSAAGVFSHFAEIYEQNYEVDKKLISAIGPVANLKSSKEILSPILKLVEIAKTFEQKKFNSFSDHAASEFVEKLVPVLQQIQAKKMSKSDVETLMFDNFGEIGEYATEVLFSATPAFIYEEGGPVGAACELVSIIFKKSKRTMEYVKSRTTDPRQVYSVPTLESIFSKWFGYDEDEIFLIKKALPPRNFKYRMAKMKELASKKKF